MSTEKATAKKSLKMARMAAVIRNTIVRRVAPKAYTNHKVQYTEAEKKSF